MTEQASETKRFWEIDFFRGIAISMMILFHILFDISYFGLSAINVQTGFWRYFGYSTAVLFVFIAGISIYISSERSKKHLSVISYYLKFFKRGLFLILTGAAITAVTWVFVGDGYIVFGILHLIGLSVIISPFFIRFGKLNALLGIIIIITGIFLAGTHGSFLLIPIGITPETFHSLDYEPLFPWFGVFLAGIAAGTAFYPKAIRKYSALPKINNFSEIFSYPGRHSLLIYLIHQPVIILILSIAAGRILI